MEPNMEQITGMMMGFFQSKAITAALNLRVFDAIDPPASAVEVCRRAGIPAATGKRLLIALHAMNLIGRQGDEYHLSAVAKRCLVSTSPQWLGWLAQHCDTFLYPLWGRCAEAIRENKDQRVAVFQDSRSWFDVLYENPTDVADFQQFLGILAQPFVSGMIEAFDFSPYTRFLDIGSGSGTLPMAVAKRYPALEIALCELPQAAAFARGNMSAAGLGSRIQVLESDVIAGVIPQHRYDLVHLGWMLHDYAPSTQEAILRNILASLPSGGTLIASETPLNEDESGPAFTALLSINMLVSTDGGVESTTDQYLARFRGAGFANVRAQMIPGPRTLLIGQKA